ncbi:MAG TPA: hypothetical protein GXX29_09320 [Firmicutes bacterium]|nr:hypothetical protein [Bacillota bacterium]
MLNKADIAIIRTLAAEVAEIAALPVQEEKKKLWRALNALHPIRPMVMIDQVCWNEMNVGDELILRCQDEECRRYENRLRRMLFQWRHFPVDMVVEPYIPVPKAVHNSGFGITVQEETAVTDPTSDIIGHKYINQFRNEDDIEKIQMPKIYHDEEETRRRLAVAHELFDGLLEVRAAGVQPYLSLWDPLASWMGVEEALYAMIDKPDFLHRILFRMTEGYLVMLDQLEEQGLLCEPQPVIHCSGAWTDELPAPGYNPQKPRTVDIWMYGMAQMLATVSPAAFKEFEVDYISRLCSRFGLVYYGCCDPLDGKMAEVRLIPNVRKVSMSPWANEERGAEEIGRAYVYSRKPNPALLAMDTFDIDLVRAELTNTRKVCAKYNCPLEFILKDISTVRYEPERLFAWAKVAMEVVLE